MSQSRLSTHVRVGYASGNLGKSVQWNAVEFFYLYFLTDLLGMQASVAGAIILFSLVWDGISDPLVGYLVDRWRHWIGSYSRMLMLVIPFNLISFLGIFSIPQVFPEHLVLATILANVIFRVGFTLVDIPHNAMLASLSRDKHERTVLSGYRFFFSSIGTLVLLYAAKPALSDADNANAFVQFSLLLALVYLLVMYYSALSSRSNTGIQAPNPMQIGMGEAVLQLLQNRYLLLLSAVLINLALLITLPMRFAVFYAKSWLGDPVLTTYLIGVYAAGQLASLPLWLRVAKRRGKYQTAILACGFLVLACSLLLLAPDYLPIALSSFFLAGFAFAGINVMAWSMIPDGVDKNEQVCGARHEALTFGIVLPVIKVFAGISTALVGLMLSYSGYDMLDEGIGSQLTSIIYGMTLLPAAGALAATALILRLKRLA